MSVVNDNIEILMKNYIIRGFDVKIDGDFLIVSKKGHRTRKVSITTASKLLDAVEIKEK